MKILLAEDNDEIRDLYSLHLENIFDSVEVIEAISGNQAISILEQNNNFDIIISDFRMENGSGADLYFFVKEKQIDLPFLLFSSDELSSIIELPNFIEDRDKNYYLNKPCRSKEFSDLIKTIAQKYVANIDVSDSDYKKVRLLYFLRYNTSLCDIYIKINGKKFVKIISKKDSYTRLVIYKFVQKKQKFLYIKASDYKMFSSSLYKTPFLIEDKSLSNEYIVDTSTATMEIIHDLVSTLGINERVIKLVDATFNQIEKNLKEDKDLYKLLNKFRGRKGYLYDHSYMCAYVCEVLCKEMNWTSIETKTKLFYASILHDVSLTDDIVESNQQDANTLNEDSKHKLDQYHAHPMYVAEIVRNSKMVPANIDTIIAQHHENPEGNGFPRGLNAHVMSQLACVFNVAHAFVTEMYTIEFDETLFNDTLVAMNDRFSIGNYRLPMKALIKNFYKE